MSAVEEHTAPGGLKIAFSREATASLNEEHYSAFARHSYIARVEHPRLELPIIVVLPLSAALREPQEWLEVAAFYAGVAHGRGDDMIVVVAA